MPIPMPMIMGNASPVGSVILVGEPLTYSCRLYGLPSYPSGSLVNHLPNCRWRYLFRLICSSVSGGHGYGLADTFYAAKGTYSLLYTCNNWTGDALKAAGVRTGWWTPFPMGLLPQGEKN